MNDEKLRRLLLEDLEADEEIEALLPLARQINHLPMPEPVLRSTAQLIQSLPAVSPRRRWSEWYPLILLRSQVRIVSREIWAASALVLLLGTLVTLAAYNPASGNLAPLAILAPIVAAGGIGLLYDAEHEMILELEDSTPSGIMTLMLARLLLIFSFDLVLTLLGSVLLAFLRTEISLMPMIMSWLVPMTFLSALAFFLSVLSRNAMFGIIMSLLLWAVHLFINSIPIHNTLVFALSLPGLAAPEMRPVLLAIAAGLLLISLNIMAQAERRRGVTFA